MFPGTENRLLRDLGRRKLRTGLTISGITIGTMALVVFGSMANKINALVAGGSTYYADKVTVSAKGGMGGLGGPMDIATAGRIVRLDGVDVVVPGVALKLSNDMSLPTSTPPMITGGLAGGVSVVSASPALAGVSA